MNAQDFLDGVEEVYYCTRLGCHWTCVHRIGEDDPEDVMHDIMEHAGTRGRGLLGRLLRVKREHVVVVGWMRK